MDHFSTDFLRLVRKMKNIFSLRNRYRIPFFLAPSFVTATASSASWRSEFCENAGNIWHCFHSRPVSQNMTRSFASIDSPSIFLTIKPCRPCWITCANFSKSGWFFTRFIFEPKSVTPNVLLFWYKELVTWLLQNCTERKNRQENFGASWTLFVIM